MKQAIPEAVHLLPEGGDLPEGEHQQNEGGSGPGGGEDLAPFHDGLLSSKKADSPGGLPVLPDR